MAAPKRLKYKVTQIERKWLDKSATTTQENRQTGVEKCHRRLLDLAKPACRGQQHAPLARLLRKPKVDSKCPDYVKWMTNRAAAVFREESVQ